MTEKKINLSLHGLDGNAYALLAAFNKQAKKEHWSKEEIDAVITEAKSGDYDHLFLTLLRHCEET